MDRDRRLTQSVNELYGRNNELKQIRTVFRKAREAQQGVQLVFVRGSSGAGKSTLIQKAFENLDCLLHGLGKFEQRAASRPFSALLNCINELCTQMIFIDKQKYAQALGDQLQPEELAYLSTMVSELAGLVPIEKAPDCICSESCKEGLERLKYILHLFLRAISTQERAVVLCFDDLQWIDQATLEILKFLMNDPELQHVIFVGSYRQDEVDKDHPIHCWIQSIEELPVVQIVVENLTVETLTQLLSDLLKREDVADLAKLVHNRTMGNAFHVLQLLDYLQAERLLEYSISTFRWQWDIQRVRDQTMLSENLATVVRARLCRLDSEVQHCLHLSSCLGFRFDKNLLQLVCESITEKKSDMDVSASLQVAVAEGLVELMGKHRYKFMHDKIHAAALNLTDSSERTRTHWNIGQVLWPLCDDLEGVESRILFICADQLNLGTEFAIEQETRVKLARLHCEAGKRAGTMLAFLPAVDYLERGVALLDGSNNCWNENYRLSLDLHTSLVAMKFSAGQLDDLESAIDVVIANARSDEDSIRVWLILIQALASKSDYTRLIQTAYEVLARLGEKIPSKPNRIHASWILQKTKRKLNAKSQDEIMSLPEMTSWRKSEVIKVIGDVFFPLFQSGQFHLLTVTICRAMELTLNMGLAPSSPVCFAGCALSFLSSGDIDSAYRLCKLALALAEKSNDPLTRLKVLLTIPGVHHWREPLVKLTDICLEGFEMGIRRGAVYYAFLSLLPYGFAYFYSGLPLAPFVKDISRFVTLAMEYRQGSFALLMVPLYQCILCLTGQSSNILDLSSGKAAEIRNKIGRSKANVGDETEWSYAMQVSFYCEEYSMATELYHKLASVDAGIGRCYPFYQARVFFYALICIHNAREIGQIKYRSAAKRYFKVVENWVTKDKAINVVHKLQILKAEMLTLQQRHGVQDKVLVEAFDKAITFSRKSGFLQDAALAAHLASRAVGNQEISKQYLKTAVQLYMRWGARGVVEYLDRDDSCRGSSSISRRFSIHSDVESGPGIRARTRFDDLIESKRELKLD